MIHYEYDPQLVEQATFLTARQDAEKECALHEALDKLYRTDDLELKQRLFREAFAELFCRFGLDRVIPACVQDFPLITTRLGRCIIREAERARAQSVDLYREKSRSTAEFAGQVMIMALCPNALVKPMRMAPWLYRQLQHVEDMLDERFAYTPDLPQASVPQQNALRQRYAAVWDIYVEGRLLRAGKIDQGNVPELWSAFCKAFACDVGEPARTQFESLLASGSLTHPQILAWAEAPRNFFRGEAEDKKESMAMT